MNQIGEICFLPNILKALAKINPNISLKIINPDALNLCNEMKNGNVDLAIGFIPYLETGFYKRTLLVQKYVCIFRNSLTTKKMLSSEESLRNAPFLIVNAIGSGHENIVNWLLKTNITHKVSVSIPEYGTLRDALFATDIIAIVPEILAQKLSHDGELLTAPCPFGLPDFTVELLWHTTKHRDPANKWLRQLLYQKLNLTHITSPLT